MSPYNTSDNPDSYPSLIKHRYGRGCPPVIVLGCLTRYFTSRPDLLSRVGGADTETQSPPGSVPIPGAAITAAQRALANPATSRVLAAGLQRTASSNTGGSSGHPSTAAVATAASSLSSLSLSSAHNAPVDNANDRAPTVNVGRVAAAAHAFSSTAPAPASAAHKRADSSGGLVPQKVSSGFLLYPSIKRSVEVGGFFFLPPNSSSPASLYLSFFFLFLLLFFFFVALVCVCVLKSWVACYALWPLSL